MDLPVLRYVDVVIGVAVVVLLACTVVTATTQLLLSSTFVRARNLRDALSDLIAQIDPNVLRPHGRYIAERLLRHPLVARDNTVFGWAGWSLRAWWRNWRKKPPLPPLNPSDTIQREEIIMLLLEWAGTGGALKEQDETFSREGRITEATGRRIAAVREALRTALRNTGIGDPAAVAASIRKRMILNECEHPDQPATLWRSQAITEVATTDFAGKIHVWYDNTMARATESYAFFAQIISSAIALVIAFSIQLDAIKLVRRLSVDDKLRASLVAEAEIQLKRQQDAQSSGSVTQVQDARVQREQIATALADLRDPKRGITPSYLALQKIAQTRICQEWMPAGNRVANMRIRAGTDERRFLLTLRSPTDLDELAVAALQAGAPVTVYHAGNCLHFVAQDPEVDRIAIFEELGTNSISEATLSAIDSAGLRDRLPGVLLSWVLVSLGAPFWYDLLKRLVGFRSILAQKDENDRQLRNGAQTKVPAKTEAAQASNKAVPAVPTPEGDDERGDLEATGAEG